MDFCGIIQKKVISQIVYLGSKVVVWRLDDSFMIINPGSVVWE